MQLHETLCQMVVHVVRGSRKNIQNVVYGKFLHKNGGCNEAVDKLTRLIGASAQPHVYEPDGLAVWM